MKVWEKLIFLEIIAPLNLFSSTQPLFTWRTSLQILTKMHPCTESSCITISIFLTLCPDPDSSEWWHMWFHFAHKIVEQSLVIGCLGCYASEKGSVWNWIPRKSTFRYKQLKVDFWITHELNPIYNKVKYLFTIQQHNKYLDFCKATKTLISSNRLITIDTHLILVMSHMFNWIEANCQHLNEYDDVW